jgi:hypothetical protein
MAKKGKQDDLFELRMDAAEDEFDFGDDEEEIVTDEDREQRVNKLFLGMTAIERMFLSIFLFMNVSILGLAFLLATRRIQF